MIGFLLDTCAISESIKPLPNKGFIQWLKSQEKDNGISGLFISVLSLGEIQKGIAKLNDPKHSHKFTKFLESTEALFQGRILDVHTDIARIWGKIEGALASKGNSVSSVDGLISATAIHHNLTVVTRNVSDFRPIAQNFQPASGYDLKKLILDPWTSR